MRGWFSENRLNPLLLYLWRFMSAAPACKSWRVMFFNRTSVQLPKESQRSLIGRIEFLTANRQHYSRHGGTHRSNDTSPDNVVVFQRSEFAVSLARGKFRVDADCSHRRRVHTWKESNNNCLIATHLIARITLLVTFLTLKSTPNTP